MSADCAAVGHELTEIILLGRALTPALELHVTGCADCAREAAEVREVVATFERAGGRQPPVSEPTTTVTPQPALLPEPSLTVPRRRFRRGAALLAAGAAVLLGIGLGPVMLTHDDPGVQVGLSREGRMIPHPWGTEVPVVLTGLVPGQTYQLMTGDAAGHRAVAGSVRAENGELVRMHMVTAMHREAIVVLLVSDQRGRDVATLPVAPPSATT